MRSHDSNQRLTMVQRNPGLSEGTCQRETYYYDTNPFDAGYSQNASGRLAAVQYGGSLRRDDANGNVQLHSVWSHDSQATAGE